MPAGGHRRPPVNTVGATAPQRDAEATRVAKLFRLKKADALAFAAVLKAADPDTLLRAVSEAQTKKPSHCRTSAGHPVTVRLDAPSQVEAVRRLVAQDLVVLGTYEKPRPTPWWDTAPAQALGCLFAVAGLAHL